MSHNKSTYQQPPPQHVDCGAVMHCHQSCSKKKHGLLSTLILAAWDITALCQPCWPGLHSDLHLGQQFCRKSSELLTNTTYRIEVLTATRCALNSLSSLYLLHSTVFASPVVLDCLRFICDARLSSLLDCSRNYFQPFIASSQSSQLGTSL